MADHLQGQQKSLDVVVADLQASAGPRTVVSLPLSLGNHFGNAGQYISPSSLNFDLPLALPRGHGRRHSVNVVNKGVSPGAPASFPLSHDNFEDGFSIHGNTSNHSRHQSRSDSIWRIGMYHNALITQIVLFFYQAEVRVLFNQE